jgi:hypothetical protein
MPCYIGIIGIVLKCRSSCLLNPYFNINKILAFVNR